MGAWLLAEHTSTGLGDSVGINRHVERAGVVLRLGRDRRDGQGDESKRETHFGWFDYGWNSNIGRRALDGKMMRRCDGDVVVVVVDVDGC